MRLRFIFFLIIGWQFCCAQNSDFKEISKIINRTPESLESSTQAIANYIQSHFRNSEDQLKAAFYWTATNINYAVEDMSVGNTFESVEQLIYVSMRAKRGLCQAYSEIFNELASKFGFESYVISGYVRQNGVVDTRYGHAWNAIKINKEWYLFDPTWAAGHFLLTMHKERNESYYIKQFTPEYFKVKPEEFIKSHMPFDPLWQFSDQIIKYKDFNQSQFNDKTRAKFRYKKIITKLASSPDFQNIQNSIVRIQYMRTGNNLTRNHLEFLKRNLEIAITNKDGAVYNQALEFHANSVSLINEYVELFNNKDILISDKIKQLKFFLFKSEEAAQKAQSIYNSISTSNPTLELNIIIKEGEMTELFKKIEQEKNYLKSI